MSELLLVIILLDEVFVISRLIKVGVVVIRLRPHKLKNSWYGCGQIRQEIVNSMCTGNTRFEFAFWSVIIPDYTNSRMKVVVFIVLLCVFTSCGRFTEIFANWPSKLFLFISPFFSGEDHSNGHNKSHQGSGGVIAWLQKAEWGTQTQSYAAKGFARQVPHVRPSKEDLTQSGSHTSFHHRKGLSRWTLFIRLASFVFFFNPLFHPGQETNKQTCGTLNMHCWQI